MPIYSDTKEVTIEVDLHQIKCDMCGKVYDRQWCCEYSLGDWHDDDCIGAIRDGWSVNYDKETAYCPQCLAAGKPEDKAVINLKCSNCFKEERHELSKAEYYGWQITTDEIYGKPTITNTLCPECAKAHKQTPQH